MTKRVKKLSLFFLFILVVLSFIPFITTKKKKDTTKRLSNFIIRSSPWVSHWSRRFEVISSNENASWPKEEIATSLNEISSVLQLVQFSDDSSFTIRYIAKDQENNTHEVEKKVSFWNFSPFSSNSIHYSKKRKTIEFDENGQKYKLCFDEDSFGEASQLLKTLHKFFRYRISFAAHENKIKNLKKLPKTEILDLKAFANSYFELPQSERALQDKSSFSKIAKKHKATYLACLLPEKMLPKVLLCREGKRYLIPNDLSFFFLTDRENDLQELLKKTENRLPLYLFKLESTLDTLPFYVRIQNCKDSNNPLEIMHALEHPEQDNRVIFLEPIAVTAVRKIYVRKECRSRLLRRFKVLLEEKKTFNHVRKSVNTLKPFDYFGCNDFNYYSYWTEPRNEGSYDRLSYIVQTKELSTDQLIKLLIDEMPRLKLLLDGKIHGKGEIVRRDALQKGEDYLNKAQLISFEGLQNESIRNPKSLFQILASLQNIANATTSENEHPDISHHILLSVVERCGFTRKEVHLAKHILDKDFIRNPESIEEEIESCKKSQLHPSTCFQYQKFFLENFEEINIDSRKQANIQEYLAQQKLGFQNSLPTKDLDTRYIWELLDPRHRYGNAMYNERIKFENMLLQNPNSKWRGKFIEWVDFENKRIPQVSYYSEQEKEKVRLRFKEGKITLPKERLFKPMTTLMFVLSKDGEFYVGYKERGNSMRRTVGHGSLLANVPTASAGRITFDNEGNIYRIGDSSGHYRPGKLEMFLALHTLQNKGCDLSKIILHRGGPRGYGIYIDTVEKDENALKWYQKHSNEYLPILTGTPT